VLQKGFSGRRNGLRAADFRGKVRPKALSYKSYQTNSAAGGDSR
jgi:hypothetical protein